MDNAIYYNYSINNFLVKDVNILSNLHNYLQIILCVYTINTSGKYPFIQYLLSNNGFNLLCLPVLQTFSSLNRESLLSYSKVYLSSLLQINTFDEFNKNIEYDGYYHYNNNIYIFFNITKYQLNIDNTYTSNPNIFALIDEIVNQRSICNIKIKGETSDFFIKNCSLNYLYDENNKPYEIPIVGFVGKKTPEKVNFTWVFGEKAKDKTSIFGEYFYFTDFKYAIRQGGWSHNYKPEIIYNKLITDSEYGRYYKGGIVRFALFTGHTKYIENTPNNTIDESEIKKQRLNDISLNKNFEVQTLRISDHDGNWTKIYDSVYLGNIELDDGTYIEEAPLIVLKEYNQQIPLTYHFIDKTSIGDKYDSNSVSYRIV